MIINIRKIFLMILIFSLLVYGCSRELYAATGIYLGSDTTSWGNGTYSYKLDGYVYYNSNTSTTLDVYSLCMWITNNGIYPIDEGEYTVHDAEFDKYTNTYFQFNDITQGNMKRIEAAWSSVCTSEGYSNTKFTKNGTSKYVYTDTSTGYSLASYSGWECFWFPSTRSASYHE